MSKKPRRYVGRSAVIGVTGRNPDAPVTNREQEGVRDETGSASLPFESDWRTRYAEAGGSYDEYAPAYAHGQSLAEHEELRGKRWEEVEAHAREAWERDRPGTWQRFKDAVRSGWDWLMATEDDRSSMRRP